jgi:hypothetical protein
MSYKLKWNRKKSTVIYVLLPPEISRCSCARKYTEGKSPFQNIPDELA